MVFDFTFDVDDMREIQPKPKLLSIYFGPVFWLFVLVGISTVLGPPLWAALKALPELMSVDVDTMPPDQQEVIRSGYIAVVLAAVIILSILGIFFWSIRNANRTKRLLQTADPQKMGLTEGLHFGPSSISIGPAALNIERALLRNTTKRDGIAAITEDRGVFFMELRTGAKVPLGRLADLGQQSDFTALADKFMAGGAQ